MAVVPAPTSTNVVPLDCYRGYVDGMRVVLASRASSAAALDYCRALVDGMRAR